MSNEKQLIRLEKNIRQKMFDIKSGNLTPKESKIGKLINSLKALDEPLYDNIMIEYKQILQSR
jgi:hypothetical protein